ncbi:MAG: ATP-binding cassette domain-containing protein [Candidatus Cloacimonetes bacterium]|nr:ATP-binding cassette domain-containing protein [Candidatus Cloacimonadota bacterium]
MITVESLNLELDGQAILRDVSFQLEDGQNLIIMGRSGSGKTMLIKTLMGFFHPDSGSVSVDGIDIHADSDYPDSVIRHGFAMVFQYSALLDSYTVFQNVALSLYERDELDPEAIRARVRKCLAVVGLDEMLDKYPSELSGGMRKRVGIARALVYDPRYIIFDEPVSGLDPITAAEILYYITQIIASVQATTITITHDTQGLSAIGDQVLFLDQGRVLYYGSLAGLRLSPDPLIRQFLQAQP